MDEPVAVALKGRTVGVGKVRIQPAAAVFRFCGVNCEFHDISSFTSDIFLYTKIKFNKG